jgi:predicted enzyme related to lactoylglutathione lyase
MTAPSLLGRPLWHELLTTDVDAATRFYTAVIGWTVSDSPGLDYEYRIWSRPAGGAVGGVMHLPAGLEAPPHWVMYIGVPSLEEAVTAIEQRGGQALSPVIDVPNVGRLRTMLDPQGAMFSVYQPTMDMTEPEGEPQEGDVSWRELYTTDAAAAKAFYFDLFGWSDAGSSDMGPMGTYHMFGRAFPLGGMMTKVDDMVNLPNAWGLYFRVPDVAQAVERVKAEGGTVLNGPMQVPGGSTIAQCLDPQGAAFSLHQPAA